MNFLRISTEFQSLQLEITKKSLEHYSYVSRSIQTTPWGFVSFNPEVPGQTQTGETAPAGLAGRFPAAQVAGGEGIGVGKQEGDQAHL